MNTKIIFIGCGNAFSYENGQNNILIEVDNGIEKDIMAVDCGTQWHDMILKVKGWKVPEALTHINKFFVTHIHADHCGGFEEVGFISRFSPNLDKPILYGQGEVLNELWNSLAPGMASLNYGQMTEEEENGNINLNCYFQPKFMGVNEKIEMGSTIIEPFTTCHVNNRLGQKASCGLLITTYSGQKLLFTSDTQFAPRQLQDLYSKADVIFHDCENTPFHSGVHAHYDDLKTLSPEIKGKTWLMHYHDGDKVDCTEDGFLGWVEQGQEFDYV